MNLTFICYIFSTLKKISETWDNTPVHQQSRELFRFRRLTLPGGTLRMSGKRLLSEELKEQGKTDHRCPVMNLFARYRTIADSAVKDITIRLAFVQW